MSPVLIAAIVVAFLVFDAVIIIVVLKRKGKLSGQVNEHLQWLADTLELAVTGGDAMFPAIRFLSFVRRPYRLEGERRGSRLSIYHYTVSTGQSSTTYTTARSEVENPRELNFKFTREGLLSKVGKSLGLQDVQTGDEHFDKLFVIKCSDPEFIRQALLDQVKEKFFTVWEQHSAKGTISLKGGTLSYDEVGTVRNEKSRTRMAAVAELVCDLGGLVQFYNR